MSITPNIPDSPPAVAIPKRPRRTGRVILIGTLVLLLAAIAVTAIVFRDTLELLLHPDRIEISRFSDAAETLRQLEGQGVIRDLRIRAAEEGTELFYRSADDSVEVTAVYAYEDEAFLWLDGTVRSQLSSLQTIPDAEAFAAEMLSPFFNADETRAIFLKFSADIIAQAGRDSMELNLNLADRYKISIEGPPMQTVRFSIGVSQG